MESLSMLVKVILALISLLLLITMIVSITKIPKQKQHDLDCKSKIKTFITQSSFNNKLRSSSSIADLFTNQNNNIECSAKRILITDPNEDNVYKTFADEYVSCYKSWTNDEGTFDNIFTGNGVFCNLCSTISFDPNVFDNIDDNNIPSTYNNFEDYINTHDYLDKKNGLIPYSHFFGKQSLTPGSNPPFIKGNFILDPKVQYSVMMRYIRGEKNLETFYSSTKNKIITGTYVIATTAIGVKVGASMGVIFGPVGSIIGGVVGGISGTAFGLFRAMVPDKPDFKWIGQVFITDVSSAKLDNLYKCEVLLGV